MIENSKKLQIKSDDIFDLLDKKSHGYIESIKMQDICSYIPEEYNLNHSKSIVKKDFDE